MPFSSPCRSIGNRFYPEALDLEEIQRGITKLARRRTVGKAAFAAGLPGCAGHSN